MRAMSKEFSRVSNPPLKSCNTSSSTSNRENSVARFIPFECAQLEAIVLDHKIRNDILTIMTGNLVF